MRPGHGWGTTGYITYHTVVRRVTLNVLLHLRPTCMKFQGASSESRQVFASGFYYIGQIPEHVPFQLWCKDYLALNL